MKKYIYIQCTYSENHDGPGNLSFKHWTIVAKNKNDAYTLGQRASNSVAGAGQIINDYVVEIGTFDGGVV